MVANTDIITAALAEVDRLRTTLKKKKTKQVWAQDERTLAKATALAWFNGHQKAVPDAGNTATLDQVNSLYKEILDASDRATNRTSYISYLKRLRDFLIALRSDGITASVKRTSTPDLAPDFSLLSNDSQMQEILRGRWSECIQCVSSHAPLAATVMMGGLLETLLLGRINRESNKAPIFKAKSAPQDKNRKTKPLGEWMLKDYIDVAHDLKWITISAREVAAVLRDFRNYIHPHKQLSHGVRLSDDDATLFWEVSKSIAVQVLKSCTH